MKISIASAQHAVRSYVEMRREFEELKKALSEQQKFFEKCCSTLSPSGKVFDMYGAKIYRAHTPGKWKYSRTIELVAKKLDQLKRKFQKANKPVGGLVPYWKIELQK